jgi:hypothetical protein
VAEASRKIDSIRRRPHDPAILANWILAAVYTFSPHRREPDASILSRGLEVRW